MNIVLNQQLDLSCLGAIILCQLRDFRELAAKCFSNSPWACFDSYFTHVLLTNISGNFFLKSSLKSTHVNKRTFCGDVFVFGISF